MLSEIDISCDLGESATAADELSEAQLWPMLTSANIACGGHTGDAISMERAVVQAMRHGVSIGGHPSYPDREHFGRRSMCLEPMALRESISEQLLALQRTAAASGGTLSHVKPHGALYNDAHHSEAIASTIVAAVEDLELGLAIVCSPHSALQRVATARSLCTVLEAFGDRRYRSDGSLVPRSRGDSLLLDFEEAATQALRIVTDGRATADDGSPLELRAGTICIHSDMPGAVARLSAIRAALSGAGVRFRSIHAPAQ